MHYRHAEFLGIDARTISTDLEGVQPMIETYPIRALSDNYIWIAADPDQGRAVIVDPGESQPVFDFLATHPLRPAAVLVTHHHRDHVNGVAALTDRYRLPVYGPATEDIAGVTHRVGDGDTVVVPEVNVEFKVLAVPGHTLGSIAFVGAGMLFAGDTLFTGGCGRLFEGSPDQMYHSLCRLAALPGETRVFCGHEYTLDNLTYAAVVDPANTDLLARIENTRHLYKEQLPAVPSTIAMERRTNPFLRCNKPELEAAAECLCGRKCSCPVEVFATIRRYKDTYKPT
jgi:hydroxyacylglutathione hydrolase